MNKCLKHKNIVCVEGHPDLRSWRFGFPARFRNLLRIAHKHKDACPMIVVDFGTPSVQRRSCRQRILGSSSQHAWRKKLRTTKVTNELHQVQCWPSDADACRKHGIESHSLARVNQARKSMRHQDLHFDEYS